MPNVVASRRPWIALGFSLSLTVFAVMVFGVETNPLAFACGLVMAGVLTRVIGTQSHWRHIGTGVIVGGVLGVVVTIALTVWLAMSMRYWTF
jgi:hypothetical protein